MMKFSLKQLEIFVAVAELNSFTKAAGALYLTQSTVSAHISSLESALQVQLFFRDTKRNIQLTPQGKKVYPAAKRILSDCGELAAIAQNHREELPLLLGASTVPGQYLLPDLLSAFLLRHSGCRYLLKRGDSQQIHTLLNAGSIRFGFVGTMLDADNLEYIPIGEDRLVMVTANNAYYQEKQRQGALGCDLLWEPTVAREEGSGTDQTVAAYMRQHNYPLSQLKIVARIDNPETIKSMVAQGAGVSILSALAVREEVTAGKLLAFELDADGLHRTLYIVTKKNERCTGMEQQFLRFCRAFFSKADVIE